MRNEINIKNNDIHDNGECNVIHMVLYNSVQVNPCGLEMLIYEIG